MFLYTTVLFMFLTIVITPKLKSFCDLILTLLFFLFFHFSWGGGGGGCVVRISHDCLHVCFLLLLSSLVGQRLDVLSLSLSLSLLYQLSEDEDFSYVDAFFPPFPFSFSFFF